MNQVQSGNNGLQEGYQEVQIGPERLEIPEEWTVTTLSNVASRFISGGTPDSGNEDYWGGDIPWTTAAVVEGPQFEGEKDFITQQGLENSSASLVPKGGILFGTRVNVANVGRTKKEIAISQDLTGVVLDENKANPDFVTWHLLFNQAKIQNRYSQGSTIQGMLTDDLKSLPLLSPPLPEQRRIADILSTVDEQIQQTDEIIEEGELLKQGLTRDLFQSGIGHTSFTPVSIGAREYQVPQSWEMVRIEDLLDQETDKKPIRGGPPGGKISKQDRVEEGPKVYVQENIIYQDYSMGSEYLSEEKFGELEGAALEPGDVVITRAGTVGHTDVFPEYARKGIMDSSLIRLKLDQQRVRPEYLSAYISDSSISQFQIKSMSHGGTRININNQIIKSLSVPLPPLSEQDQISEHLQLAQEKIDQEREAKEKLEDLKRGLMQDLLTGKVRVDPDN